MLKIEKELKWISTLGGPLILMEHTALNAWRGDSDPESSSDEIETSDYERACSIEDYVGVIKVADSTALVLGDLPSQTAHVQINTRTFLLVRWIWANDEEQVREILSGLSLEQDWSDTEANLTFPKGNLVLFDSVYDGESLSECLKIQVEPGNYHVSTRSYQPNKEINLFLILITDK